MQRAIACRNEFAWRIVNSDLVATSHIELIEHDDELDLIEESHAEVC